MKIGLIADVHADVHALRHALDLLEGLGAAEILCAGDLVNIGHYPNKTLRLMRKRGIPCVRGNHDRKFFECHHKKHKLHHSEQAAVKPKNLDYLRNLPFSITRRYGDLRLAVYHGSLHDDQDIVHPLHCPDEYLAAMLREAEADVLVLGHTHLPMYVETTEGLIINPGAVLMNYNSPHRSTSRTCGLLDTETLEYRLFSVASGAEDPRVNWPWWAD